ncbi:MAG: DUF4338 domain-containing protein, partial [Rhodothermaceae bacterium]|nr:DUF4338 domain-containing protein [Rhodothermaceae bacterium]
PPGTCTNLGRYLLSRVLRRLLEDFRAKYGSRPYIIETFVGPAYEGTCFRGGAGFEYLGLTKGQGRHAPSRECTRSPKKVFGFALVQDWRTLLAVAPVELRPHLEVGVGLATDDWAVQEFGNADLGHAARQETRSRDSGGE